MSHDQPKPSCPSGNFVHVEGMPQDKCITSYFNLELEAWKAENFELKKRVEELENGHRSFIERSWEEISSTRKSLKNSEAQNATLREVLKSVEDKGEGGHWDEAACPECNGSSHYNGTVSHSKDCRLNKCLTSTHETSVSSRPREERLEKLIKEARKYLSLTDRCEEFIKSIDQELSQEKKV